jgi:hypothetical protein
MMRNRRLEVVNMLEGLRQRGAELHIGIGLDAPMPSLKEMGWTSFSSPYEMWADLRKGVIDKWMRQHHELELGEPGEPNRYNFIGQTEW